ncbi:poly(A) RNA polymerase, mitochondrial [Drosophila guanche]|uniref:Blast:Poly(A) RNA polymerase, mitochondrial n=1 Tax=Drosophila guanche TaxID=7266 RepID=A0A3B0JW34_DROGU|nr:poly(A) RNA polymerase, mitochondrial [Drosophila guanche]SPP86264.1 blast:Poly(A) RNA polymerase%2C mitochondrial [Drosophila guanche]
MNNLMRRAQNVQLWRKYCVKQYTTEAASASLSRGKPNYDEFIGGRQVQAQRSIVVQVSSEKSYSELYNYCSRFGSIVGAHHYCVRHDDDLHYILLEYSTVNEAAAAIDSGAANGDLSGVPVRSPFLWFKAAPGRRGPKLAANTNNNNNSQLPLSDLLSVDGTRQLDQASLLSQLRCAASIEQQVQLLHEHTQLNDLGVRMRFLAALQVQQAISGMFPAAQAHPFGSSVNGFGRMGCDLDLILRFDGETGVRKESDGEPPSRLIYHTKENLSNGRSQTQRHMECFGDMLHLFLPGVCHVRRILQARVPIIKYHHEHLNLEVDLSMSNLSGFYMSELLYMFGQIDQRVRPLTFSIRRWAQACGLTNPSPGRWISNFSLTCLVMYFLQQLRQPILPTIGALVKAAEAKDVRVTEDGINCTFGRDLERVGFQSRNTSSLSELLLQFFEFYSQFDFHNRAISLNEGRQLAKPDHSAMYIVNPLEQLLNVSKNVSLEECERLRIEVRNAAWILESEVENSTLQESERQDESWGLLNLFKHPEKAVIRPNMFFKPRMVEVSDLFEEKQHQQQQQSTTGLSSDGGATASPPVAYKNVSVRQQVQSIKAATRTELKQLRESSSAAAAPSSSPNSKNRRSR